MAQEFTFSIIKPNATKDNNIGNIIAHFEKASLEVAAAKFTHLTKAKCEEFYSEHKERPFFNDLVSFMTSGPVLLMVLKGENAIKANRDLMGATNPAEAAPGTIRALYAKSIDENAVHGSDSPTSAAREINLFFEKNEIF